MGAITRSIANNITTSGVFTSSAIANSSVTGITTLANAPADGITFISSQTASNSASLSFTSGLTSTYKAYKFVFSNIHPRTDDVSFSFNLSCTLSWAFFIKLLISGGFISDNISFLTDFLAGIFVISYLLFFGVDAFFLFLSIKVPLIWLLQGHDL